MGSSRGFGSHRRHLLTYDTSACRPVQTRWPCGSPPLVGVNQATPMHSPDHSTKGTPSALGGSEPQWPLTAGEYVVSGSISSPLRGAFHLSLTVLVRYRSLKVFSLGGWSPLLPTNSPGFVVLRVLTHRARRLATGLSPAAVPLSNGFASVLLGSLCQALQPRCVRTHNGLGCSRFARHYSGNLVLMSSRRATEMFQFARGPPHCL